MVTSENTVTSDAYTVLVTGATGKTGRRVVKGLTEKGITVRQGSRSATPHFDWNDAATWDACLAGADAVYINYSPDLAIPGVTDIIEKFVAKAAEHKIKHMVLLSGRGEEEAQACERLVQVGGTKNGIAWTIVRAGWFNQNFSEGAFLDMVRTGTIALPAAEIKEPFVDLDDIAEVIIASFTERDRTKNGNELKHSQQVYEVTGPRLMTFKETAEAISAATGCEIKFVQISHEDFIEGVKASGAPEPIVWLMDYLFTKVLDGHNAYLTDGIERALNRKPKDFSEYAREVAASDIWAAPASVN